jgi:hypothetical protein
MSPRQFHATYRLPVVRAAKRAASPGKRAAGRRAKTAVKRGARRAAAPTADAPISPRTESAPAPRGRDYDAVRQILHAVATDALRADDRAAFVQVLNSLDQRTAEVLSLFQR